MYKLSFIHTATFLAMLGFFSIACESNTKKTAKIADSGFTAPTLIANVKHDSAKSEKSKIDSDKPEASAEPVKRTAEKSNMINVSKKNQQTVFGYDVVSALPPNHVTDGSVDYTSYLQDAIDKHDQLTFPAFPVLVNDKGLNIGSNKTIKFPKGSVINLAKTAQGGYSIVRLFNVQNVVLDGPVIKGDRNNHIGTGGEWGMGLDIRSSNNITIKNPKVTNCWGDGIYLGQNDQPNQDVTIINAYCDNNRRNGISIISANGLKLISPYAANSNGTLPMAGLDIEPNSPKNELKGIYISGLKTENNAGNGLDIVLNNLYGGGDKNVDIQIKNPKDVASVTGARVISFRQKAGIPGSIRGMIHIDKPLWSGQKKSSIDTSAMREKAVRLNMQ